MFPVVFSEIFNHSFYFHWRDEGHPTRKIYSLSFGVVVLERHSEEGAQTTSSPVDRLPLSGFFTPCYFSLALFLLFQILLRIISVPFLFPSLIVSLNLFSSSSSNSQCTNNIDSWSAFPDAKASAADRTSRP